MVGRKGGDGWKEGRRWFEGREDILSNQLVQFFEAMLSNDSADMI